MVWIRLANRLGRKSPADHGAQLVFSGLDPIQLPPTAIEAAGESILKRSPDVQFVVAEDENVNGKRASDGTCNGDGAAPPVDGRAAADSSVRDMVSLNGNCKRDREVAAEGAAAVRTASSVASAAVPAVPYAPRKFASLASFVAGPCNKLALYSAEMVVRDPGKITPLFVHGPTSVGKTHLLEGIWSAERKAGRGATSVYLSAEQFTSQFLEALRGGGLPVFRRKYRGVRLLLLDDLHFLTGKRATQVEMMNTVNTLLREGRQLVVAADRPPVEFSDFMPELVTRLSSGMVCRIEPPEYSTRLGIVATMCRRLGIELPADVQRYVATQFAGHARELSGALPPEGNERGGAAEDHAGAGRGGAGRYGPPEQPRGSPGRHRKSSLQNLWARIANAPIGRQEPPREPAADAGDVVGAKTHCAALSEIGQFFGNRSHSTVVSAKKRVDQWMALDEPISLPEQTWKIDEAIRQVERQLIAG